MSESHLTMNELRQFEKMPEKEMKDRALYLATQMARHSIELTRDLIGNFHPGSNAVFGNGVPDEVPDDVHKQVVKELATLGLWLALVTQSNENGRTPWLEQFFHLSWAAMDYLYEKPTAQQVLDLYPPEGDIRETCLTAAMNLGHKLQFASNNEIIYEVGGKIFEARSDRATLLKDALKASANDLSRLVSEPLPMVIG